MDTGRQPGRVTPRSPGTDARSVVLALVEDRVDSLASVLLAAEIATALEARLYIAHLSPRRLMLVGIAGVPVPASLWAEADRCAEAQLHAKVAGLLALTSVDWTFASTVGSVHRTVLRLVSEVSPVGVVISAPRRRLLHGSLARWLVSQPNVPTVIAAGTRGNLKSS